MRKKNPIGQRKEKDSEKKRKKKSEKEEVLTKTVKQMIEDIQGKKDLEKERKEKVEDFRIKKTIEMFERKITKNEIIEKEADGRTVSLRKMMKFEPVAPSPVRTDDGKKIDSKTRKFKDIVSTDNWWGIKVKEDNRDDLKVVQTGKGGSEEKPESREDPKEDLNESKALRF